MSTHTRLWLPVSFSLDNINRLIDDQQAINDSADLKTISNFLDAAQNLINLPQYRAIQLIYEKDRHCVRCHTTYNEKENYYNSCDVPHAHAQDLIANQPRCCRYVQDMAALEDDILMTAAYSIPCYEVYHTDNAEILEERGEYNHINVRRCMMDEEGNCTLKSGRE